MKYFNSNTSQDTAKKVGLWLYSLRNLLYNRFLSDRDKAVVNFSFPDDVSENVVDKKNPASQPPPEVKAKFSIRSFLKKKITRAGNVIAEIVEPLYWVIVKFFHLKQGSWPYKAVGFIFEHYILLITGSIGIFLGYGVTAYEARHIVVYAALPVFLIMAFTRPVFAFVLYLAFTLGMIHEAIWNFPKLHYGSPLLILALLGWILSIYVKKAEKLSFIRDTNNTPILGLWIISAIQVVTGYAPVHFTVGQISLFLSFFICTHIINKDSKRFFQIIYGLVAIYGFYVYKVIRQAFYFGLSTSTSVTAGIPGRLSDNNELAASFCMMLAIFYALFRCEKRKWLRGVWIAFFILDMVAVIYTRSRGGYIAMLVVLLLVIFKLILAAKDKTMPVLFIILFALGGYGAFYKNVHSRVEDIKDWKTDQSAQNRILSLVTGMEMLKANFFTGVGFGTAMSKFMDYAPATTVIRTGFGADDVVTINRPGTRLVLHNAYAQMAGESGIFGIIFFLMLLIGSVVKMTKLRKHLVRTPENEWVIIMSYALQFGLISYMTSAMFLNNAQEGLLYMLVACITSLYYMNTSAEQPKMTKADQVAIFLILILFAQWLLLTVGYRAGKM